MDRARSDSPPCLFYFICHDAKLYENLPCIITGPESPYNCKRTTATDLVPDTNIEIKGHTVLRFPNNTDFTANSPYYLFAIPELETINNPNL